MFEAGVASRAIDVFEDVASAYDAAKRQAAIADTIIIFGSFVTVTAALPLVK